VQLSAQLAGIGGGFGRPVIAFAHVGWPFAGHVDGAGTGRAGNPKFDS